MILFTLLAFWVEEEWTLQCSLYSSGSPPSTTPPPLFWTVTSWLLVPRLASYLIFNSFPRQQCDTVAFWNALNQEFTFELEDTGWNRYHPTNSFLIPSINKFDSKSTCWELQMWGAGLCLPQQWFRIIEDNKHRGWVQWWSDPFAMQAMVIRKWRPSQTAVIQDYIRRPANCPEYHTKRHSPQPPCSSWTEHLTKNEITTIQFIHFKYLF